MEEALPSADALVEGLKVGFALGVPPNSPPAEVPVMEAVEDPKAAAPPAVALAMEVGEEALLGLGVGLPDPVEENEAWLEVEGWEEEDGEEESLPLPLPTKAVPLTLGEGERAPLPLGAALPLLPGVEEGVRRGERLAEGERVEDGEPREDRDWEGEGLFVPPPLPLLMAVGVAPPPKLTLALMLKVEVADPRGEREVLPHTEAERDTLGDPDTVPLPESPQEALGEKVGLDWVGARDTLSPLLGDEEGVNTEREGEPLLPMEGVMVPVFNATLVLGPELTLPPPKGVVLPATDTLAAPLVGLTLGHALTRPLPVGGI